MSKPVNDVRASSTDARYAGVVFSGSIANAIKQAKNAPDYGLPDADLRAPAGMSRDRAALLSFLRLLGPSPLAQSAGVPFAVISAELSTLNAEGNAPRTAALRRDLDKAGARFASVLGSYKGSRENSFAVLLPTYAGWHAVQVLGRRYDQESVLLVNADRSAALHYYDGRCESVGTWTAVDSVEGLDAWTQDGSGQYYAVKAPESKHSKYSLAYALERGFVTAAPDSLRETIGNKRSDKSWNK